MYFIWYNFIGIYRVERKCLMSAYFIIFRLSLRSFVLVHGVLVLILSPLSPVVVISYASFIHCYCSTLNGFWFEIRFYTVANADVDANVAISLCALYSLLFYCITK